MRVPFNPALFPGLRSEKAVTAQVDKKLSQGDQREVYAEVSGSDSKAESDAEEVYPEGLNDRILTANELEKKAALADRLTDKYRLPIEEKHHLTARQLQHIVGEGVESHWPAP